MITAFLHYGKNFFAVNFSYNKAAFDFSSDAYRNVRKARKIKNNTVIRKIDKSILPDNGHCQTPPYEFSPLPAAAADDLIR